MFSNPFDSKIVADITKFLSEHRNDIDIDPCLNEAAEKTAAQIGDEMILEDRRSLLRDHFNEAVSDCGCRGTTKEANAFTKAVEMHIEEGKGKKDLPPAFLKNIQKKKDAAAKKGYHRKEEVESADALTEAVIAKEVGGGEFVVQKNGKMFALLRPNSTNPEATKRGWGVWHTNYDDMGGFPVAVFGSDAKGFEAAKQFVSRLKHPLIDYWKTPVDNRGNYKLTFESADALTEDFGDSSMGGVEFFKEKTPPYQGLPDEKILGCYRNGVKIAEIWQERENYKNPKKVTGYTVYPPDGGATGQGKWSKLFKTVAEAKRFVIGLKTEAVEEGFAQPTEKELRASVKWLESISKDPKKLKDSGLSREDAEDNLAAAKDMLSFGKAHGSKIKP